MAEYPVGYTGSSSPTNFDYLLADVWWSLYPSGELPRYQVTQTPIGGQLLEYRASVSMTASVPTGVRSYNFQGGPGSTPDRAIHLAALAGLIGLRHQESAMQQSRAFHFYPTLGATPQQVRFPRPLAEADAAVITMSRYMTAQYALLVELIRDARDARRALAAALSLSTAPPTPATSGNPPSDQNV